MADRASAYRPSLAVTSQRKLPRGLAAKLRRAEKEGRELTPAEQFDYFPTPMWGTRALTHVILPRFGIPTSSLATMIVDEPACGEGWMARPLAEVFGEVRAADIHPWGYGAVRNYLEAPAAPVRPHFIITNPPFDYAEEFIHKALEEALVGVAILARSSFKEGQGRYRRLFRDRPPIDCIFVERLPMSLGRMDEGAGTMTSYSWFLWLKKPDGSPLIPPGDVGQTFWIPPDRKALERDGDYLPLAA